MFKNLELKPFGQCIPSYGLSHWSFNSFHNTSLPMISYENVLVKTTLYSSHVNHVYNLVFSLPVSWLAASKASKQGFFSIHRAFAAAVAAAFARCPVRATADYSLSTEASLDREAARLRVISSTAVLWPCFLYSFTTYRLAKNETHTDIQNWRETPILKWQLYFLDL